MGAPREVCSIQLVEIQYGERLAITPEPTFAPDRATCRREAKGRGYRATTQVKGWSPEITYCVGGRYCSYSIRQNSYDRKWRGCKSPTGSETVAQQIWDNLPITAQAERWGDEVYFYIKPKIGIEKEYARDIVEEGDVAYWPTGPCMCLFFGLTPISRDGKIKPASTVNVFGKLEGEPHLLNCVKDGNPLKVEKAE